jgi:hypothetical protein
VSSIRTIEPGPLLETAATIYRRDRDDLLLPGSIEVGTEIAVTAMAAALERLVAGEDLLVGSVPAAFVTSARGSA